MRHNKLPKVPNHQVIVAETVESRGFLKVKGTRCLFDFEGSQLDTQPPEMIVDCVERKCPDVVAVMAWERVGAANHLWLVSCIRPALVSTDYGPTKRKVTNAKGVIWEVPAGIIDPEETGYVGVLEAAARELYEEVGIQTNADNHVVLADGLYTSGGMSGERLWITTVDVTGLEKSQPVTDGSLLEQGSKAVSVEFNEVLRAIGDKRLVDGKTVLGAMLLANHQRDCFLV